MSKIENKNLLKNLVELSVANFYAFDKKSGLEYYSGTLKSHELSNSASEPDKVKGGQSNDVIYTIPKNKELSLKITDVVNRQDIDALKWSTGGIDDVGTDIVYAMHMPKNYPILKEADPSTDLYIELAYEPLAGEEVSIYNNNTNTMILATKVTVDATDKKKYVITETGLVQGDTVFVTGFKRKALSTEQYIDITSDSVTPELLCVIEIPLFNTSNEIVANKQYIFPRTQISTKDVKSSGASEKKEVDSESTISVLKDTSLDYLGRIVYVSV
jgi:hypothetical protein